MSICSCSLSWRALHVLSTESRRMALTFALNSEKQLLGTETVLAFRSKGVRSIVCGLSANDLEGEFLKAGADAFMSKPFPCQEHALKRELLRILQIRHGQNDEKMLHLE